MIHQPSKFIFKLRHNICLEGDVTLAEMELNAFLPKSKLKAIQNLQDIIADRPILANLQGLTALGVYVRDIGTQGYIAQGSLELFPTLVKYLSFVQNIYCITQNSKQAFLYIQDCKQQLGSVFDYKVIGDELIIYGVSHYALIELSDVIARRAKNATDTKTKLEMMLEALLSINSSNTGLKIAKEALQAKNTTSHLSHDIHYYKAKFFPRLVRSTLNVCRQRLGGSNHQVIDCFSGSGTTLLEASILGMPSFGIDIDPLSVLIAKNKLEILHFPSSYLAEEVRLVLEVLASSESRQLNLFQLEKASQFPQTIQFPSWLMKNRQMTQEIANQLYAEIQKLSYAVSYAIPELQGFFQVLMSDAIARKIKMRFLGTGVGRFSLTFTQRSMIETFINSAQKYIRAIAAIEWLKQTINLKFAKATSINADARVMGKECGMFDILVTSPPYLPAASGRESYAKARSPSLIALGLKNYQNIDDLVDDSVGSMNHDLVDLDALSEPEKNLVEWLAQDKLRRIKSTPTARYFLDMRAAFKQMYEYLKPGALAAIVSGKQSTFYQFSTRETLYVVQSAEILAESAQSMGFEVEALHDVQLQKFNKNARPRSLDDYYETLIYLRRK